MVISGGDEKYVVDFFLFVYVQWVNNECTYVCVCESVSNIDATYVDLAR